MALPRKLQISSSLAKGRSFRRRYYFISEQLVPIICEGTTKVHVLILSVFEFLTRSLSHLSIYRLYDNEFQRVLLVVWFLLV